MKRIKEETGFTLIEMLIVLLIISVLVLIAIPNVTKHSKSIDEKGCEAYVNIIAIKNHSTHKRWYINLLSAMGKGLIDLASNIAHKKHKKIEVMSVQMELPTPQEPFIHCGHRGKHFHNFFIGSLYQNWTSLSRGLHEGSFYCCLNTVKTPLFVASVHDEQPLSVTKKQVKYSQLLQPWDISAVKPFLVSVADEEARTALKRSGLDYRALRCGNHIHA